MASPVRNLRDSERLAGAGQNKLSAFLRGRAATYFHALRDEQKVTATAVRKTFQDKH